MNYLRTGKMYKNANSGQEGCLLCGQAAAGSISSSVREAFVTPLPRVVTKKGLRRLEDKVAVRAKHIRGGSSIAHVSRAVGFPLFSVRPYWH